MWQDGEALQYTSFFDTEQGNELIVRRDYFLRLKGANCSNSEHFAQYYFDLKWYKYGPDKLYHSCICGRRWFISFIVSYKCANSEFIHLPSHQRLLLFGQLHIRLRLRLLRFRQVRLPLLQLLQLFRQPRLRFLQLIKRVRWLLFLNRGI